MPLVLCVGPFVLRFFAREGTEPPRVHVRRDDGAAKFWLDPVRLDGARDIKPKDVHRAEGVVRQNEQVLLDARAAFFKDHDPATEPLLPCQLLRPRPLMI